jgi:RimJ/RimL family protein N-acetyltransferase
MTDDYKMHFQLVDKSHHELILGWLDKPHVIEYFHGEGLENTIDGLRRFIENDSPRWDAWVGHLNDNPFSYFMVSTVTDDQAENQNDPLAKWVEFNKKMITLDLLIGEEEHLGKGLATPMIQQFLADHYADADIVFIDPECANTKAIHVYEKAGFKKIEQFVASWHPVPHWLMQLKK